MFVAPAAAPMPVKFRSKSPGPVRTCSCSMFLPVYGAVSVAPTWKFLSSSNFLVIETLKYDGVWWVCHAFEELLAFLFSILCYECTWMSRTCVWQKYRDNSIVTVWQSSPAEGSPTLRQFLDVEGEETVESTSCAPKFPAATTGRKSWLFHV